MKEMHIYQNNDGTYRVEILSRTGIDKEVTCNISRADVTFNITIMSPPDEDVMPLLTFTEVT